MREGPNSSKEFKDRVIPPSGAALLAQLLDEAACSLSSLGEVLRDSPGGDIRKDLMAGRVFHFDKIEKEFEVVQAVLELASVARPALIHLGLKLQDLLPALRILAQPAEIPENEAEFKKLLQELVTGCESLAQELETVSNEMSQTSFEQKFDISFGPTGKFV